jgi:hypothetical protein
MYLAGAVIAAAVIALGVTGWVASGTGSGTITWDGNTEPGIAGYKVYFGTQPGSYLLIFDSGNQTFQIISNLTEGATYYAAVTAYDTNGRESDLSAEVNYTPPAPAPVAGPPLTITVLENNSLRIYFEGLPGVTYGIEYTPGLHPPIWQRLEARTANYLGQVEYIVVPDPSMPAGFYRAAFP